MRVRLAWIASLVLASNAGVAAAEIYRYVDRHGRTHFTDSYAEVPEAYRDQVREISGELGRSGSVSVVPGFGERPAARAGEPGAQESGTTRSGGQEPGTDSRAAGMLDSLRQKVQAATGRKPSTGLLVFALLLGIGVFLGLGGGLLTAACNIVGEPPPALREAVLIVLIQVICGALASGALNLTLSIAGQPGPGLVAGVAGFAATTLVNTAVLKGMHCGTWGAAAKVTLAMSLLALLLVAPVVYCAAR